MAELGTSASANVAPPKSATNSSLNSLTYANDVVLHSRVSKGTNFMQPFAPFRAKMNLLRQMI